MSAIQLTGLSDEVPVPGGREVRFRDGVDGITVPIPKLEPVHSGFTGITSGTYQVTGDTTPAPPPDTVDDALSRLEDGIAGLLSELDDATQTLTDIAAIDAATASHGRDFVNRLLRLFGFKERVSLPGDAAPVDAATARLRTIQRAQQRLIKARQTERAAGDIADKLQACAEYAVRNTEPVDAYDLSNEERKTEDEIRCLETQIDRFRDTEARAAARAETAERVLVEMGAWPKAVG